MRILIVGGGVGGLTLAAFLKDSSIEYDIVERASAWGTQGYALSIWQNGRRILEKLGLGEEFDHIGTPVHTYSIFDGRGRKLRDIPLSQFYGEYGMALDLIERKTLHDWLLSKIDISWLRMGVSIDSVSKKKDEVEVVFTDGRVVSYDLVVGADGIHSQVRDLVFGNTHAQCTDWRVWYGWVDNKFKRKATVEEYIHAGAFISLFDCGEKTLAIISAPASHTIWDESSDRIIRLKAMFSGESAVAPEIFSALKPEDMTPSNETHIVLKKWVQDRVVLLGDAAHGFGPHAGIGGSMAMEDGYVLAAELIKASQGLPLDAALRNYESARRPRVNTAYNITWKMRTWTLVRPRWLRGLINGLVPWFPSKPFITEYEKLLRAEI